MARVVGRTALAHLRIKVMDTEELAEAIIRTMNICINICVIVGLTAILVAIILG